MSQVILTPTSEQYPSDLLHAKPVPECLYCDGDLSVLGLPAISIVGSRDISSYGEAVIRLLIPSLVRAGLVVVSGLAYGVDAAAHRAVLAEGGRCVAVLGSALDRIYPASHGGLYKKICSTGCVISEYPPGTGPQQYHFPARNRIVAALSSVVLIVEAGEKSGTLTTARHAHDLGRTVCVVPSDITRLQSVGVNALLKDGATPITSADDILALYRTETLVQSAIPLKPALTGSPALLYDLVSRGIHTLEGLIQTTGWDIPRLHTTLSILEIDGYIVCKQNQWLKTS